jgi:hypothetical protein
MPPSLDHVPVRFSADLLTLDQMSDDVLRSIAQTDLPDDKAALYESLLITPRSLILVMSIGIYRHFEIPKPVHRGQHEAEKRLKNLRF